MSLAREDALHRTISLREKKILELERKIKRRKSYEVLYHKLMNKYEDLHAIHIKLLQKTVDLQDQIDHKDNLLTLWISRR
jgi:hypothetical protein